MNLNPDDAPRRRLPAWCVGVAAFVVLAVVGFWNYYPPLAERLQLAVTFDSPRAGGSEPLIVTGKWGTAEFVYVKYLDEQTAVFGYDVWGHGGPTSAPVRIERGKRHTLEVQLPALTLVTGAVDRVSDRMWLKFDGATVLETGAGFRMRGPQRLWFGLNPVGGSSCGKEFSGQLTGPDGRRFLGGPRAILTWSERVRGWLTYGRWQVITIALASALLAWGWSRYQPGRWREFSPGAAWRAHRAFTLTAIVCLALFATLTNWPALWPPYPDKWGWFYEFQALSFLQGRMDVPADAIYSEAFLYRGKIYGYFGPTPSLLRLPFVIFGIAFAELTRPALVTYFAGCLVASYLLLRHATALLRPAAPQSRGWIIVLFTAHVGLGSSLFFLGNRAQVYHEAILCGAMFALFTCWCALRHLAAPAGRWWLGALGCGVLAVNARPSTGLFALTFTGCVAVVLAWREFRSGGMTRALARPLALGVGSVLGFATFNAVSYLKFESFEGMALKYHSQYPPERRAKLGNASLHLSNLPHSVYTYLLRPNFHFERGFPWLYPESRTPRRIFPEAFTEQDPTVPLTFAMPALCLLAVGAGVWASVRPTAARGAIGITWAAVAPMTLVMFAAFGSTHRYTADFCPFLICTAALAIAGLEQAARDWRTIGGSVLTALTLWACALNPAITLHTQGESDWVPKKANESYQALRQRVDRWFAP
jgi:hypothetical protein